MKHLKTIQTIVKVAKVLANIVFVCCIIGACACVIGLPILIFLGNSEFAKLIFDETQPSLISSILGMVSGLIWCIAEIIISYMAMNYCKRELEVGTPFTYGGAKELKRFGIYSIAIPLVASVVESIVYGMYILVTDDFLTEFNSSNSFDIVFGLALILIAILCEHGAETVEMAQQAMMQEQQEAPIEENQEQTEEKQD